MRVTAGVGDLREIARSGQAWQEMDGHVSDRVAAEPNCESTLSPPVWCGISAVRVIDFHCNAPTCPTIIICSYAYVVFRPLTVE